MGFRRFSFRGLKKVEAEWTLVCLALERGHLRPLDRRRNRGRNSPAANGAFEPTRTPSPRASGTTARSSLAVCQLDALTNPSRRLNTALSTRFYLSNEG